MDSSQRQILMAIAEVATPPGAHVPQFDADMLDRVDNVVRRLGPGGPAGYGAMLRVVDLAAVPLSGRRLSRLDREPRARVLERLNQGRSSGLIRAVTAPIKMALASHRDVVESLGASRKVELPMAREVGRWEQRIFDAGSMADEEIEVDAVVVGTGAGGAPVANALAGAGYAVLMLEAGNHYTRKDFNGPLLDQYKKLYRDRGLTFALGNTLIPIPIGKSVGGSTTINSGTCYRAPAAVQHRWQLEDGLRDFAPGSLDAHYERVETMLDVAPAHPSVLGGCADVIARGCEALGYTHGPLLRNAPGCDGQGVCCFGCPTDAKRSTNVSYVPAALEKGAMLFTGARVETILCEGNRAVGVIAKARDASGNERTITVRAATVVLACGTIHTPALLLRNGLANSSGRVGRDLTIHPASHSWARFDESIRGWEAIPQGYAIDEFIDQGIRFEGAFVPIDIAGAFMGPVGPKWTELVEKFDELASFGFMVADTSRGRVSLDKNGKPRMRYWLNRGDLQQMIRAQGILARVFLAAGATEIYPAMRHFDRLSSEGDIERMEREAPKKLRAFDMDISAYHPLGTCRMGRDPSRYVVAPNHETHDVANLFICDGSAIPGPLGVNPQMTVMAFSERASAFIAERIDRTATKPLPRQQESLIEFDETMTGSCERVADGVTCDLSFHVNAALPKERYTRAGLTSWGALWRLQGTLDMEGLASGVPCHGSLRMRPLSGDGALIYDLSFTGNDGEDYQLRGEKNVSLSSPIGGMTTLHTSVRRRSDNTVVAQGVLRFELSQLLPWLASWRLSAATSVETGAPAPVTEFPPQPQRDDTSAVPPRASAG